MATPYDYGGFLVRPRQHMATTGKRYDMNRLTRSFIQGNIPAMRAHKRHQETLELHQKEQEDIAERHAETIGLERERLAEEKRAAKEAADLARARLHESDKARRETEKQGKYGMAIQAADTVLSGLQSFKSGWATPDYPSYTGQEEGESGGWEVSIATCTCLGYLYGPYSPQVRYARVFCGRFLDLETLLGYYQIADRVVVLWDDHPWLIKPMEKLIVKPFYNFMLWKLGRKKKVSWWSRAWSKFFLGICRGYEKQRVTDMIVPERAMRCIEMVRGGYVLR